MIRPIPKPLLPKPASKRPPKGTAVTVCVAAACDSGRKVVTATDGLLSLGAVTADVMLAKMYWQDDWLYLYAGSPANTKMIFESMYHIHQRQKQRRNRGGSPQSLTCDNIQSVVLDAYQERRAHLASFGVLAPYNLTIDEFTRTGRERFTPEEFSRLSAAISNEDRKFSEQLLVIGWGKTEAATMLYEVSPWGTQDHALTGVAAIGMGAEVALAELLLLGQSRDSKLGETLYAVAAAKFAAERSQGQTVGEHTALYVSWKRKASDNHDKPPAKAVPSDDVKRLRDVWNEYGRPRIPEPAWRAVPEILQQMGFANEISADRMTELLRQSASQKSEPGQ
jgi:20S proteasome alpha/beta subunit